MDRRDVEDIFRLSEAQEALLLHSLHGRGEDAGFLQLRATLTGSLDLDRFRRAWAATIARHPMLRASVHWEGLKHPVQVIARTATVAVDEHDLSRLPEAERLARVEQLIVEDRTRGLDVRTGPVMRVTVVRQAARTHELLWTCHHLLLDGWSGAIVLNEVLQWYRSPDEARARDLSSSGSFHEYVTWARAQDVTAAEHFWRARLGNDGPSRVAGDGAPHGDGASRATASLTVVRAPLESWARAHGVTVVAVVFGCWALLVHRRSGTARPIFGVTLSGRSVDVERFGSVVGMFANTVPLQVAVDPTRSPPAWFRRVFEQQQEAQRFEYAPLGRILNWAGLAARPLPFDSLVVHANYPRHDLGVDREAAQDDDGIRLADFRGAVTSAFPVTLVVKWERDLVFELLHDPARVHADAAADILDELSTLVDAVLSAACATVGDALRAAAADRDAPDRTTRIESPRSAVKLAEERPHLPAADAVEVQLTRIFGDLLDVRQIGRDENFFELGGDSLLLPLLVDRIEGDFGVTLPLGVIFEAPTARALATAVTSRDPNPAWRSLVAIREHGCRPPLYLVNGLGGEMNSFYTLARYLHPEQPVYVLQPPAAEHATFEQIAEHYLREIRRTRPTGPYLLGGYCLGGCIAFEMARQLAEEGERVPLLIIIDSVSPGTQPRTRVRTLVARMRRLASRPPAELLDKVKRRFGDGFSRFRTRFAERGGVDVPLAADAPRAFVEGAARRRHVDALRAYRPRPVSADVWLLRTTSDQFAADLGWRPLVQGRLTIETIPGHHELLLKHPHLPRVAHSITAALETLAREA